MLHAPWAVYEGCGGVVVGGLCARLSSLPRKPSGAKGIATEDGGRPFLGSRISERGSDWGYPSIVYLILQDILPVSNITNTRTRVSEASSHPGLRDATRDAYDSAEGRDRLVRLARRPHEGPKPPRDAAHPISLHAPRLKQVVPAGEVVEAARVALGADGLPVDGESLDSSLPDLEMQIYLAAVSTGNSGNYAG